MAADVEIHSFLTKFMSLRKSGINARMSIECKSGETFMNLEVHLANSANSSSRTRQKYGPTPSRLRRRERRSYARATQAGTTAGNAVHKLVEVEDNEARILNSQAAAQAVPESPLQIKANEASDSDVLSKPPLHHQSTPVHLQPIFTVYQ